MYWPVGGPRVYAARRQKRHSEHVVPSRDGITDDTSSIIESDPDQRDASSASEDEETESEVGSKSLGSTSNGRAGNNTSKSRKHANRHISATEELDEKLSEEIIGLRLARNGHSFVTITRSTLTVWQSKPTVILGTVVRSAQSLRNYGDNISAFIRPDSAVVVVQTSSSYLITYSLANDPNARAYTTHLSENSNGHSRRQSSALKHGAMDLSVGPGEATGIREVDIRFRMIIRVDAGISRVLALDDELVVATEKPPAMQCIKWAANSTGPQTSTELLTRMPWFEKKAAIVDMVYNRPMNLSAWVASDGRAYAVQRLRQGTQKDNNSLFKGYCFHNPEKVSEHGLRAAINARFSLIAVGCADGQLRIYTARDYAGHIPLSLKISSLQTTDTTGQLTVLSYSQDGYCLFAGFEKGWMTWSVYGKPLGSSFNADRTLTRSNDDAWLEGVHDAFWTEGGSEIMLVGNGDNRLWVLEMARSTILSAICPANIARPLIQTSTSLMVHRNSDSADGFTPALEGSQWQTVQLPASYLARQWPIRSTIISPDGKYVAVAGRRGLAHYSMRSGRWKTFEDPAEESEFIVRGGMCWHQHALIAAVECNGSYDLRIYSREKALGNGQIMHIESIAAPIVTISPSGPDSLLVYTYENILYHYIISAASSSLRLVQVGHIALHGLIRAPPRVRSLSWIVPEDQLENGDPSQDVAIATVIFLVDGKLVLLQPRTDDHGGLKYEMRIIAQNVEYYALMRDMPQEITVLDSTNPTSPNTEFSMNGFHSNDLRDSLWYFDGSSVRVWMDVQELLATAPTELGRELAPTVGVPVDFYPLSVLLSKGILFGVETELVQRRDINFSYSRFTPRTHLFLPALLRHHLSQYNSPAASHLAHYYRHLPYFPHALEILLHDILDDEVDKSPDPEQALLPVALAFLSSFPEYLDIIVNCTRKTELRSWGLLFSYLPEPHILFEESLNKGSLKTAGGYLLVLHTLDSQHRNSEQMIRLLQLARQEGQWDLCKELARFMIAADHGETIRRAFMEDMELKPPRDGVQGLGISGRRSSNGVDSGGYFFAR